MAQPDWPLPTLLFGLVLDILPFHEPEQPGEMVAISILLGFVHLKYRIGMKDSFSINADARSGL